MWCFYFAADDINGLEGAWVPAGTGTDEYLQVNMDEPWKFTAVHTQGRDGEDEWVTSYKLQYYDGVNDTWVDYTDSTGQDVSFCIKKDCYIFLFGFEVEKQYKKI